MQAIAAVAALVGLMVLALILSASAIATGVVFGVFAGVVVGLAIANLRRAYPPRQQVTHQHLHVYQVDAAGQTELISEASREVTVR